MLDVPRSARLAAWGTAAARGQVSIGAAVRAVSGQDEPHTVVAVRAAGPVAAPAATETPSAHDLPGLLAALTTLGCTDLRLVLPVPGDLVGLGGPREFNERAVDVGECVLLEAASGSWGLVPQVSRFGSDLEPGFLVEWQLGAAHPAPMAARIGLAEAEQELRRAMLRATQVLTTLDVARWREEHADAVVAVRDGALAPDALPADLPARAHRAAAVAARVLGIVELAELDDGAAVTSLQADRRRQALREVSAVARRGLVAAVNAGLEPG